MFRSNDGLEQAKPEIVVLAGQSVDDVKELLKDDNLYLNKKKDDFKYINSFMKEEQIEKAYKPCESLKVEDVQPQIRPEPCKDIPPSQPSADPAFISESFMKKEVDQAKECLNKAAKIKLAFDDAPHVGCGFVNLDRMKKIEIKKDFNLLNTWRRLANVGEVCDEDSNCLPDDLKPTQELMDYIIAQINRKFPKLEAVWEGGWNPCLLIHGCPTQISMTKLTFAHNGLKNIVDGLAAQQIISDIILKKLEALFI